MSRTINSQALVLLDRMLGLSGPGGEQYTTLDDGNVQQVLEISEVARRSLTPAGSSGFFSVQMRNTIGAAGIQRATLDPYNLGNTTTVTLNTNAYPVPVPRGFDVWLIGATCWAGDRTETNFCQLELIVDNSSMAININTEGGSATQLTNDTIYMPMGRWDTFPNENTGPSPSSHYAGFTENGTSYLDINVRVPRDSLLGFVSGTSANDNVNFCDIILGLFPEGLGQDVAT